jgi:putative thioredoxin
MIFDVTEQDFETQVIERSRTVPVVVDFWAEWCGPCRQLGPILEQAVTARGGKVALAKLDTDSNQSISSAFGIQGIPAVKAFRDGRVVAEFVGAQPRAQVERFLDALLPSEADALVATGDEAALRKAVELERAGSPDLADAFAALDAGEQERALDLLIGAMPSADGATDELRKVVVGILDELGVEHPLARDARRRLAAALY